ncbi:MAG: DnaD domain protein, partial [Oscillospiraceae bacterium]|nr:DnaD domain protein [Oscillospiraceae bacterium]
VQRGSKEIKLDPSEIAHSLEQSQELKDLFVCTEKVFGRLLNHMEQRSLIWIHSYLGMRSEVILLLLGYCVSIDKISMSYAESIAISWMERDITTHEQADAEIKRLNAEHSYLSQIRKMFEMQHAPTTQQKKYIEGWRTAGYSMELLQYAYEITIESIEKLNFKYINTILEKWAAQGITTPEQAQQLRSSSAAAARSSAAAQDSAELDEYLSVVNRFRKE